MNALLAYYSDEIDNVIGSPEEIDIEPGDMVEIALASGRVIDGLVTREVNGILFLEYTLTDYQGNPFSAHGQMAVDDVRLTLKRAAAF